MKHSIRIRLLIATMALVVPLSILAGWLLVEVFASRLVRDIDVALEEEAETAVTFLAKPAGAQAMNRFMARLAAERDLGTGKQVMVTRGGEVVGEWPYGARAALAAVDPALRVATYSAGPATDALKVTIGVRAGAALRAKQRLTALLALGIPGALAMFGLGLWAVMGLAFSPLEQAAREVRGISGDDLFVRLNVTTRDDEVGQMVAALNGLLERLGASVAEMKRFTADAAHELRTPLTVLRAGLEVALARERSTAEYRAALEEALAGTDRLCGLAGDLLTLARIEGGEETGPRGSVALDEMAEEIVDAWSPVCSRRGVTMHVDVPPKLSVSGKASDLYRLFYNLVDNAVTHSPPGGRVLLSAAAEPPWVHVTIADEGPGIRAEEAGRVFDRFYRGTGAIQGAGSGLGLSIACKIAAAHGGKIELIDADGGCVVRVTLPLE